MKNVDVTKNSYISWIYPEIYNRKKQNYLELNLIHTRASDGIRIKFDSERDGWIIEQASVFQGTEEDFDMDWKEVIFIKAWGRDPKEGDMCEKRR